MTKKILILMLFLSFFPAPDLNAFEIKAGGSAEILGGYINDLDFNSATKEDKWYGSQRFKPTVDFIFNDKFAFINEFQISSYQGENLIPGSSFDTNSNNFKVLNSHLRINPYSTAEIKIGYQNFELPSFTFGNPLFNGHTAGLSAKIPLNEHVDTEFIFARPFHSEDSLPDANTTSIFGLIFDLRREKSLVRPFFFYSQTEHNANSPYNWASAPDHGMSYITAAGIAAAFAVTDKTNFRIDMTVADSNNKHEYHHYESKGGYSAVILETRYARATPGFFAWNATGNTEKLQEHWDYGFIPVVGNEKGFAPTRLAFKGGDSLGRDSLISASGVGTAGVGFYVNDIKIWDRLTHAFKIAYFVGTSEHQGNGAPAGVNVPGYVKSNEPGLMTDKDHAAEIDLDTTFKLNDYADLILQAAYLISGFKDKTYDKNVFDLQLILKLYFTPQTVLKT